MEASAGVAIRVALVGVAMDFKAGKKEKNLREGFYLETHVVASYFVGVLDSIVEGRTGACLLNGVQENLTSTLNGCAKVCLLFLPPRALASSANQAQRFVALFFSAILIKSLHQVLINGE